MSRSVSSFVGPRFHRSLGVAALVGLGACNSVLGIEELHEGPAPGGGATDAGGNGSGNGTSGGSNGATGGSDIAPTAGKGGTSAEGGDTGQGGTSTTPQGGDTNEAGAPNPDDPKCGQRNWHRSKRSYIRLFLLLASHCPAR